MGTAACNALYCTQTLGGNWHLDGLRLWGLKRYQVTLLTWLCVVNPAKHWLHGRPEVAGTTSEVRRQWTSLRHSCDAECWVDSGCVGWPVSKTTPKALASKFSEKLSAYMQVYMVDICVLLHHYSAAGFCDCAICCYSSLHFALSIKSHLTVQKYRKFYKILAVIIICRYLKVIAGDSVVELLGCRTCDLQLWVQIPVTALPVIFSWGILLTYLGMLPPPRSTQPCIASGSLNWVPALAGVKVGKSPLPGGR